MQGSSKEGARVPGSEIGREQEYIASLYERIDLIREQASARLALALRQVSGTAQAQSEIPASASHRLRRGDGEASSASRSARIEP